VGCICELDNTFFDGSRCIPCRKCHPNATTLIKCLRGSVSDITQCKCIQGTYGDGSTSCTPCPICHSSQYLPKPCSNEILNPNSLKSCTCLAGTYSLNPDATMCTQCSSGFYQPAYGASNCLPCPSGKYSTTTIGKSCV
jgi:hypothetical protein